MNDTGGNGRAPSGYRRPKAAAKVSDVLASDLRQRILVGRMPTGSPLPSEADLIDEFGVSRTTVREALRLLEVEGLISIKRGPNGGIRVAQPSEERVMNALGVLLQFHQVPMAELLEAREVMEPPCAALAAKRATRHDIDALVEATDAMEAAELGSRAYHAANLEFHVSLAAAGHNEVLRVFLASMRALLDASSQQLEFDERQLAYGVKAHRRIIDAIRRGDTKIAADQTLRHVRTFENWLVRRYAQQVPVTVVGAS